MAERRKTPNILGDLLGGEVNTPVEVKPLKQDDDLPAKQADVKTPSSDERGFKAAKPQDDLLVKQQDGKALAPKAIKTSTVQPASQPTVLPASQENGGEEEDEAAINAAKIKVTFYLSEDTVEYLEDSQSKLRKLSRTTGRKRSKAATSKSAILEEAVRLVCSELEERGMESQIAKKLL